MTKGHMIDEFCGPLLNIKNYFVCKTISGPQHGLKNVILNQGDGDCFVLTWEEPSYRNGPLLGYEVWAFNLYITNIVKTILPLRSYVIIVN